MTGTRSRTAVSSSKGRAGRRLGRAFFDRPCARVARELLGARIRVRTRGRSRAARIVETEAYGRDDPASHTYRGPTRRNRSMFGAPGTLYVYRIHQVVCANLVTRSGEAVLLRAGAVEEGEPHEGAGPGRLCRALGIALADDGRDVSRDPRIALWPRAGPPARVVVGPRVGIRRAAERPLRFYLAGEPEVSRPRRLSASPSPSRSRGAGWYRRSRTRSRPASAGGRRGDRTGGR